MGSEVLPSSPAPSSPPPPSKVIAMHLNYRSRAAERGKVPAYPSYFLKPVSSVAPSGRPVKRPRGCELLAFEGEIALVIGTRARNVEPSDGWSHVGWITAANDLGIYDLRYADGGSNLRSKGADGFTPLGPEYIAAADVDPGDLRIRTWVNGELVQDASTGDELIFDFGTIVADLARLTTLVPGDVILTGTPTGSSVVVPGDVVEVEVTGGTRTSGRLRSPIVESDVPLAPFGAMPRLDSESIALAHGGPAPTGDRVVALHGQAVRDALETISTATLASQLRRFGFDGCMLDGLVSTRPDVKMVGLARTVRYLPEREDLAPTKSIGMNAQKRAVDGISEGEVLVISARSDTTAGTIGDILALRAQVRGAAGIVTDGAIRDSVAIADLDIPTYSAAAHPAVLGRRHVPWDTDVAVACAGALIQPGDLLVGDADGVVVLPAHVVADIVELSIAQEREERFIAEQVRAGASVDGLYPMSDARRREYESWTGT